MAGNLSDGTLHNFHEDRTNGVGNKLLDAHRTDTRTAGNHLVLERVNRASHQDYVGAHDAHILECIDDENRRHAEARIVFNVQRNQHRLQALRRQRGFLFQILVGRLNKFTSGIATRATGETNAQQL